MSPEGSLRLRCPMLRLRPAWRSKCRPRRMPSAEAPHATTCAFLSAGGALRRAPWRTLPFPRCFGRASRHRSPTQAYLTIAVIPADRQDACGGVQLRSCPALLQLPACPPSISPREGTAVHRYCSILGSLFDVFRSEIGRPPHRVLFDRGSLLGHFNQSYKSRSSLLPLWEKVAIGGLLPPSFKRTPMLCIGYAKSAPDEGFWPIDRPKPLTRLRFAKPPSPTRGEGKKAKLQRPSSDDTIHFVTASVARNSSAMRCTSGAEVLPCATATSRSQRRDTAMPTAACREPSDIVRS